MAEVEAESSEAAFAMVKDIEARWRVLTESEKQHATVLVEDASDLIRSECPRWAKANPQTLKRVTCAIVIRAMRAPLGIDGAQGASQISTTAGPYTQALTFTGNSPDLYLTKVEARSLGGRRSSAFELNFFERCKA